MNQKVNRPAVCCFLFLLTLLPAWCADDFRTRIAIVPMTNRTGEATLEPVCQTVADTVGLVLRLLGSHAVSDEYDIPALQTIDTSDPANLRAFAEEHRLDEVLFGEAVKPEKGFLTFRLSIYNHADDAVKYREERSADTLFDVFDSADEITVALLSHLSTVHIGFGSIDIERTAGAGAWTLYLNGERIRNPGRMLKKVLNGTYTLTVRQDRLLGDTEVFRQEVAVFEDKATVVRFAIPPATADESAFLEQRAARMTDAAAAGLDQLLQEMAAFQETVNRVSFDDTLAAAGNQALRAAGDRAAGLLGEVVASADENFYAEEPDFRGARDEYRTWAEKINRVYEARRLAEADAADTTVLAPTRIAVAPDGVVYTLEGFSTNQIVLRACNPATGTAVARWLSSLAADDAGTALQDLDFCCDRLGNIVCPAPSGRTLLVVSSSLAAVRTVKVPDLEPDVNSPYCVAISPDGVMYVFNGPAVRVFEPGTDRDADIEDRILAAIRGTPTFSVSQAFFDGRGLLYLYDRAGTRLLRFSPLGELQVSIALSAATQDSRLAMDRLGYLYATDPDRHALVKCDPLGNRVATIGSFGFAPGEFAFPTDVDVDAAGNLYVADTDNNRIQVLRLAATPILVPEVLAFGERLAKRARTAERALERMEIVDAGIRPVGPVLEGIGSLLLWTGAVGLTVGVGWFAGEAEAAYADYLAATDPDEVLRFREVVTDNWLWSRASLAGSLALVGSGSYLLATMLLSAGEQLSSERRAVREITATDMDGTYELDREDYRSLRRARSVGIWTGVVPPVAGLVGLAAVYTLPSIAPSLSFPDWAAPVVVAASVALPPVASHGYAGRFHGGLLVAGLVADAFAGSALAIELLRPAGWTPAAFGWDLGSAALNAIGAQVWENLQTNASLLFMAAALGVRLTAGAYDASRGWLTAKDYNLYRAVKKVEPEVSLRLVPDSRDPGVAMIVSLRY